jgi:hypothetical protein
MSESLIQQYHVGDEWRTGCKTLSTKRIMTVFVKETPANTRASSRGNTRGVSVTLRDWA